MSFDDDAVEPSDFGITADESLEVIDTEELVTELQGDIGGSPIGELQNRLVRVSHPGGAEQGENNWHHGQLVRRKWGRS